MSVPVSKRQDGELKVFTKGRQLVARTLTICSNEKHFSKKLRWAFTSKICDKASEMYALILQANSVLVENEIEAQLRINYWKQALACATALEGFADLSIEMSSMTLDKVRSWEAEIREVKTLIRNRIKSDKARFYNG